MKNRAITVSGRQAKRAKPAPVHQGEFVDLVKQALRRFHDPEWLSRNSPLATPYLLGRRLLEMPAHDIENPTIRGQTLQVLLQEAVQMLQQRNGKWDHLRIHLLDLRYFRPTPLSASRTAEELNMAEATFARHHNAALKELAQQLLKEIKPALRLESPVPSPIVLGRDEILNACLRLLQQGKTVGLSGPGGIGKSTLGIELARTFAGQEVFWLTIHPQLTDRLNDILFRLAYFLHLQGASALWLQLMADQGVMQEYTITLLQHELAQIGQTPLILCFDEVDLLRPNDLVAHAQIVSLLESLRGLVPMLLIGQRHLVEVDHQCMLTGLSSPAIAQLAHQAELRLSRAALEQIQALTQGNPRLIELSLVYYQSTKRIGVAEQELLSGLTKELSLEFLLRRIWRHLTEAEMLLLETLAIFRNPAPIWVWQTEESQAALKQLSKWRLIQEDIQGGLTLLPVLKEAIQRLITIEELEKLHRRAAQIRTQCGQYTSAAWHYVQAGDPKAALKLWDTHRQQELDQGQAAAALSLLQSVSAQHLTQKTRELLYLRRAELQKLLGYYNEALAELQTAHWRVPFLEAQVHRMQGDIAALRGETVQALDAYASSQATLEQLLSESASLHRAQGYSQVHDRNFGVAQREVFRIRHDAANLEGIIFDKQGNKREALASLEAAVRLAQEADYPYGEANARNHLGVLYGWQRQVDRADRHLRVAIDYFRGTGRLNKLASATVNLAFVHLLCDNYQEAVAQAEEALELFTKLGEEFGRAVSTELLAEAHLALGNLEQAETYAWQTFHAEDVNTQPDALRTLGEIRLQQGNKEEAAKLIQQSLDIAQSTENKVLEAYAWRALGLVQIAQKEQEAALDSLRRAITLFQACDMPVEVKKTKREIS